MEHVVRALTRSSAGVEIADIAFDHSQAGGATGRACEHIVEVRQMAGGKVVDSDDFLTEREEVLQQVGANEPATPVRTRLWARTTDVVEDVDRARSSLTRDKSIFHSSYPHSRTTPKS